MLAGCQKTPVVPPHVNQAKTYGYHPTPGYSRSTMSSHPAQFGKLPPRTESAGEPQAVAGFPPGHPLHKDESQMVEPEHPYDQQAHEAPVTTGQSSMPAEPSLGEPANNQEENTQLPHTNFNY